jgi:hypothetical protein
MSAPAEHAVVHDAIGPDLPLSEAIAALSLGVIGLLFAGVLPSLLGTLAIEHRLDVSSIGLTAGFEGLTMGLATAAAGIVLKPKGLKWIGAAASLLLALADLASLHAHGGAVMAIRAIAGVPEGILLWITVGMIARTRTPERWAGVFFTALTAGQMAYALLFAQWVLPVHGADGGFLALAVAGIAGIAAAFFIPAAYAPLSGSEETGGMPPSRGWFALFATLIYIGAASTVGVFIEPLALQAGLTADVANTAVWVSLGAQILGGAAATAMAGHVRYFTVFIGSTVVTLAGWAVFLVHPAGWVFITANAATGLVSILIAAFLVPMTIEADPSRRAAVLSGSTQVLAGALGPFAASVVVADDDAHGAILLGTVTLLIGLALIAALHFTSRAKTRTV